MITSIVGVAIAAKECALEVLATYDSDTEP